MMRKKWKKLLLFIFFSCLLIKIHYDYQSFVSTLKNTTISFSYNSSYPAQLVTQTIKDAPSDNEVIGVMTFSNEGEETRDKDSMGPVPGNPVRLMNKLGFSVHNKRQTIQKEEDNTVKIDTFLDTSEIVDGSRVHSFLEKMQEVIYQTLARPGSTQQATNDKDQRKETTRIGTKILPLEHTSNSNSTNSTRRKLKVPQRTTKHPDLKIDSTEALKRADKKTRTNFSTKVNNHKIPQSPHKVSHVVDPAEISLTVSQIEKIRIKIAEINERQLILNERTHGPLHQNSTVIVIQVHNRLANLKYLVESLENAPGIASSLVIFSHDFWDDGVNEFIQAISSFKTLQIFFPHSIQLNPFEFPGRDPNDCQWNWKPNSNSQKGNLSCINSQWPDLYGHYREASFTQIKHHWWWKLHRIFDHIRVMKDFTGQVLFLEEDHYVVPDILHVLRLLVLERDKKFSQHSIFCLGNYLKQIGRSMNVVERGEWIVNKYNLGFVFDRRVFNIMKTCQGDFCTYDDYNWDWTLAYMGKSCAKNKFAMMSMKSSRVFHIGSCGTHVHRSNCNLEKEVNSVKAQIKNLQPALFPTRLEISKSFKTSTKPKKPNGGWGDLRDRQLCYAFANGTDTEDILNRLKFPNITKL